MAVVINMPRLSDTMEEGVVAKWHKKVGDNVKEGDLLAEIETDKATMDFEAFPGQEGKLIYIGIQEGEAAPVDQILAILGTDKDDVDALITQHSSSGNAPAKADSPEVPATAKVEPARVEIAAETKTPAAGDKRILASPLARKMALDKGIDLQTIAGTGEGGRIVKRDIDNAGTEPAFAPVTAGASERYSEVPVSQMRKTIARRLSDSKFTAPHFYLTIEIDMDQVVAARKRINEKSEVKISFNDFVIKAAATALTRHPNVNSSWQGDNIRLNNHIHIGVAVAVDEGLLVPVIRHANAKPMSQISTEVREYAQKAKDKKLQPSEWEGNTFTISNLGMFGIDEFTAIINSPDACIMAVGGIRQIPVVKNGQVVPGNVMKVTLSCDHRVVDGATGAAFLQTFRSMLEEPMNMLV